MCVYVCGWVAAYVCVCTLTFTASVHGDEPSLLPSSGWNSPSFQWDWCECISSSESCSGFYGYQYHADVLRFCRGLRREGGELHGNICGEWTCVAMRRRDSRGKASCCCCTSLHVVLFPVSCHVCSAVEWSDCLLFSSVTYFHKSPHIFCAHLEHRVEWSTQCRL